MPPSRRATSATSVAVASSIVWRGFCAPGAARCCSKKSRIPFSMVLPTGGLARGSSRTCGARTCPTGMDTSIFRNRLLWIVALSVALAVALALTYKHTALSDIVTPENTIEWVTRFDGHWWAPIAVILSYSLAQVVMFPRPLITLAAVVAFGPYKGFAIAMTGIL